MLSQHIMIWLLWKWFFKFLSWFSYIKEAKKSYCLLSGRMFVMSGILSDSNNQLSGSIFVMADILSGAWKKIISSLTVRSLTAHLTCLQTVLLYFSLPFWSRHSFRVKENLGFHCVVFSKFCYIWICLLLE